MHRKQPINDETCFVILWRSTKKNVQKYFKKPLPTLYFLIFKITDIIPSSVSILLQQNLEVRHYHNFLLKPPKSCLPKFVIPDSNADPVGFRLIRLSDREYCVFAMHTGIYPIQAFHILSSLFRFCTTPSAPYISLAIISIFS